MNMIYISNLIIMSKSIPSEIKNEIIEKIQSGKSVSDIASMYGVGAKTIYGWLSKSSGSTDISLLQYNKLKHENNELKRIIGMLTLDMSRGKKSRYN